MTTGEDMPIYGFKCRRCNNTFEVLFLSGSDKPAISCPVCKSKKAKKMMSVFGGKIGNTSSASCSSCAATSCSPA